MSEVMLTAFVLVATFAAFTLSASAGLGGSLILIPALAVVVGPKEAVILGALLLGANNVFKVIAYRNTVPFRAASVIVVLIAAGAALGASVLIVVPETYVAIVIIASFALSLIAERRQWQVTQRIGAPLLAFFSGATSGFSGTSGPLKGAALRNLQLDRLHMVGAASLASMVGDLTKASVFANASLFGEEALQLLLMALPLMLLGTAIGRRLNQQVGERGYAVLFWSVMAGYSLRLVLVLG